MKKKDGFTLIELMVSLAILAIIAMIAAPNLSGFIEKRKIESLAGSFEHSIVQARSEAVLNRRAVTVHINSSGLDTPTDRYWSLAKDVNIAFFNGVCSAKKWSKSELPVLTTLVFLPQGNISNLATHLEIRLQSESAERYIYLTNFGRISSSTTSAFVGDCE